MMIRVISSLTRSLAFWTICLVLLIQACSVAW
jgi:hypothetical protein